MSLIMLTTVLKATVLMSSELSSLSGIIFHPLRLPRHFLTRKAISCCWLTGSSLSGLGFLKSNVSLLWVSHDVWNTSLDTAGELVLDRDCFSLAALKLACLLSSLLKLRARCRAGLMARVLSRGESGGSGDRGTGHSGACAQSSSGCSGMFLKCQDRMVENKSNCNWSTWVMWMDFCLERHGCC